MKAVALTENKQNEEMGLEGEHGLSVYIEYGPERILLDTGSSDLYYKNAVSLGIPLDKINLAVLSHAHYDHSGGFNSFFSVNRKALLYMQSACKENCFRLSGKAKAQKIKTLQDLSVDMLKYIGIPEGLLEENKKRIRFVEGDKEILPGVWLIAHHTPLLENKGRKAGMCRLEDGHFVYDDFSHEQSLVLETGSGLVVFNSCCHAGPDLIVKEIIERPCFWGKTVYALFGGFHLKDVPDNEEGINDITGLGRRLLNSGVMHFYTGHCTGEAAFSLLSQILGERMHYFKTGTEVEIR